MILFPKHIFKLICQYCDDRIEKRQKRLWNRIIPNRRLTFSLTKPIFITIWVQDKINTDMNTDTGIIRNCIVMWNWNIVLDSFIPFSLYTKLDDNRIDLRRLGII